LVPLKGQIRNLQEVLQVRSAELALLEETTGRIVAAFRE
jgi:hypothetical protein